MKKLAVGLLLLVLVGCAHRTTTIDVHNLDRSDVVVVTDLRPAHEKENRTFSVSVTNEAYGIYRKGDGTLEPPMMRLLQHRVFEKFGEPQQVIVHHMVVYRNAAAGFRQAAAVGAVGGVAGAGLASGRPQLDSAISTLIFDRAPFDALAEKEHRRAFPASQNSSVPAAPAPLGLCETPRDSNPFTSRHNPPNPMISLVGPPGLEPGTKGL
jgi:hypothetical protein